MSAEQEQNYLAAERAEEIADLRRIDLEQEAHEKIRSRVEALKVELPCLSMGYIGNYECWGDYTSHYIFLPHSGRVGRFSDSIFLGEGTDKIKFQRAIADWDRIEFCIRRQYAADPNRIAVLTLRNGRLFESNGTPSEYAPGTQFMAPEFKDDAEANVWLKTRNYPSVVR